MRGANFLVGVGVTLGTIVGAGFLALPYAASKSGIDAVLFLILISAVVVSALHIAYAEVVVSTPEKHRLPGYALKYLGPWGKRAATASVLVGQFGVLLIYVLFGGSFVELLLPASIREYAPLIFWFLLTLLIVLRFRTSSAVDAAASGLLVILLILVGIFAASKISAANFAIPRTDYWFFPYGIVMFSLIGLAAVPEVASIPKNGEKKRLRAVILAGTLGAAILYIFFTWVMLGALGNDVEPNALASALKLLPDNMRWLLPMVGLLAVGTSYFTFGVSTRNVLQMDFGVSPIVARTAAASIPLLLYLSGARDIVVIISFLGGIWVSIDAALIFLMRERVLKEKNQLSLSNKLMGRVLMAFFFFAAAISIIIRV